MLQEQSSPFPLSTGKVLEQGRERAQTCKSAGSVLCPGKDKWRGRSLELGCSEQSVLEPEVGAGHGKGLLWHPLVLPQLMLCCLLHWQRWI